MAQQLLTASSKYISMANDDTKDLIALIVVLVVAFFIGLIMQSFDAMVLISLPLYIGLRYLQTRGLL